MSCTIAMALLGICQFSLADEPVSSFNRGTENSDHLTRLGVQEWMQEQDRPRVAYAVTPRKVVKRRHGVVTVRPKG